jgi:hypothetical protein
VTSAIVLAPISKANRSGEIGDVKRDDFTSLRSVRVDLALRASLRSQPAPSPWPQPRAAGKGGPRVTNVPLAKPRLTPYEVKSKNEWNSLNSALDQVQMESLDLPVRGYKREVIFRRRPFCFARSKGRHESCGLQSAPYVSTLLLRQKHASHGTEAAILRTGQLMAPWGVISDTSAGLRQ